MSYSTSEPGIGPCTCCGRPRVRLIPTRAPDSLPATSVICEDCKGHLGSTAEAAQRRDREHVRIWRAVVQGKIETHGAKMAEAHARAEAKLAAMQQELDDRPVQVVFENLDKGVVDEAISMRDSAYRSRDFAYAALSELWMLHRDAGGGKCRCGLESRKCKSISVLKRVRGSLDAWTKRQWELERLGLRNNLPDGHPARIDPHWRPGDGVGDEDDTQVSA